MICAKTGRTMRGAVLCSDISLLDVRNSVPQRLRPASRFSCVRRLRCGSSVSAVLFVPARNRFRTVNLSKNYGGEEGGECLHRTACTVIVFQTDFLCDFDRFTYKYMFPPDFTSSTRGYKCVTLPFTNLPSSREG